MVWPFHTNKTAFLLTMKHYLFAVVLICLGSNAFASPWTGKLGLDSGSFGGVVSHDFIKTATVSGLEWDTLHIRYNGNEIGEIGVFGGKRDVDSRFLIGPSFGTSGMNVGKAAKFMQNFFDWPILTPLSDAGSYVNAYVNIGIDISNPRSTPFCGLGGVLKFGGQ